MSARDILHPGGSAIGLWATITGAGLAVVAAVVLARERAG